MTIPCRPPYSFYDDIIVILDMGILSLTLNPRSSDVQSAYDMFHVNDYSQPANYHNQ